MPVGTQNLFQGVSRRVSSGELPVAVGKYCQISVASRVLCCITCCPEGICIELLVVGTLV